MRDGDGAFLVQTEQHLRLFIAEVIDDAVVEAAIAGAWIERDVGHAGGAQGVGRDIAAESGRVDAGRLGPVDGGDAGVRTRRGRAFR